MGKATEASGRIGAVDLARGAALVGMAAFHLTYDLALFGLIDPAAPFSGFWWVFARVVAAGFLCLAGLSLWLAHGHGLRGRAFVRRLAILGGAALLVTGATWIAMPERFIYFGILHAIAVFSVLGLPFLRAPAALSALVAVAVVLAPMWLRNPAFDAPWLWWTGLSASWRPSADFEPVLPWFGAFLAGLALGRTGLVQRLPAGPLAAGAAGALAWAGRHSLPIYLAHQPVLMALVWCVAQILA